VLPPLLAAGALAPVLALGLPDDDEHAAATIATVAIRTAIRDRRWISSSITFSFPGSPTRSSGRRRSSIATGQRPAPITLVDDPSNHEL
jgi:hypothetical protein